MIRIDQCPDCGLHRLRIGEEVVVKTNEIGICNRYARVLDGARNRGWRQGMKMLCEEVGYSEETAERVLSALHGNSQGRLQ